MSPYGKKQNAAVHNKPGFEDQNQAEFLQGKQLSDD